MRGQGSYFAVLLSAFLCFMHWLVVEANGRTPALFPETLFFVGMGVFVVALVLWAGRFILHFVRRP
jgi:hypothetical protein